MSEASANVVTKIFNRVFPSMPDFYGLMNEQCTLMADAMEEFVDFMRTGNPETASRIAGDLEKKGDELKRRNMEFLNNAFATPMDREEIYRAIEGIDHVVNYAKTTVREMEAFEVGPDPYTLEMAEHLKEGYYTLIAVEILKAMSLLSYAIYMVSRRFLPVHTVLSQMPSQRGLTRQ